MVQAITLAKRLRKPCAQEARFDLGSGGSTMGFGIGTFSKTEVYPSPRFRELCVLNRTSFRTCSNPSNSHFIRNDFERTWNAIRAHLDTRISVILSTGCEPRTAGTAVRSRGQASGRGWARPSAWLVANRNPGPQNRGGSLAAGQADACGPVRNSTQRLISARSRAQTARR